jgi:hypothetical protein
MLGIIIHIIHVITHNIRAVEDDDAVPFVPVKVHLQKTIFLGGPLFK